ncbi:MAG: hypothetical protein Fur006_11440 [Coleofasciculaceae cyanobacterium]
MEIKTDDYRVWYNPETITVNFKGLLRESELADYKPLETLLDRVMEQELSTITMNFKELEFLNSSGMSVLSRFVIGVRKKKTTQLVVKGAKAVPWQGKFLGNWQRLMPT